MKGGTGAEAGGAAQGEPLQGGGGAARQQRGAQENSRKYCHFILCDVQLKINQVICFFPLITCFSSESQWFVSTRAQAAVASCAANNYRAWQHHSSWISLRKHLWSRSKGVRLGSPVLVQHPRATGTALPAGEQGWNVQGAGCAVLLVSSQGTARLSWVLLETWRAAPGTTTCSCISLIFPQCDGVPGSCSGTGA